MTTSRAHAWLLASRPRTWPAAIAPVLLGSALAAYATRFAPAPAALCLGFALLAQIAANFANDYYDFLKGADAPGRIGPARAVASGLISPGAMRTAMMFALVLAFVVGCGLIYFGGWWLLAIGVASLLAAVAYTGGPWPLGYHGLGDVCVLVFFGFVAVIGTYYVQAGWPPPTGAWTVAAACGLLAANILVVNNARDIETDARAGKRTLAVRFGRRFALWQYAVSFLFAMLTPLTLVWQGYGPAVLLGALPYPFGRLLMWRFTALKSGDGPGHNRLLAQTALLLVVYAALLGAGLAFSAPSAPASITDK